MYSAFLLAFQYFLMLPYFIFKCNSFLFFSHFFQYLNLVFTYFTYGFSLKNYHALPLNFTKKRRFLYISHKTSLFPFGFKNDFYVICALTAVLVEYVVSDDRSFQSVDHSSEIETAVCDVPVKHLLCRLHTGIIDSLLEAERISSTGYRRKLSALINHTGYGIREIRASHTVHDNTSDCKLSLIWFTVCLTLDDRS